jgi:hypothetical protein
VVFWVLGHIRMHDHALGEKGLYKTIFAGIKGCNQPHNLRRNAAWIR